MSQIPENLKNSPCLQLVTSQGWNWKDIGGGQISVEFCPFCKKGEYKFYMAVMNPEEGTRDGLYFCHHGACPNNSGNLRTLKEHLGLRVAGVESRSDWAGRGEGKADDLPDVEACHSALLGDAEVMDWLINVRGFTEEVIKKQKLGLKEKVFFKEAGETRALVVPYLVNNNIVFAKYRTIPPSPKDFAGPKGWDAPLYNGEILVDGLNEVIFVEGEANTLFLLSQGYKTVVGVPGANIKKAAWIETLDKLGDGLRKYILYDEDKAGRKNSQELASRIGVDKCLKIVLPYFEISVPVDECKLCDVDGKIRSANKETKDCTHVRPGKDINEWFMKGGGTLEAFEKIKENAVLFDVTGVKSSMDALEQLEDELKGKVDLAPKYITKRLPSLAKLVGFEDGDIIDVLAPEKVGKTTFGLNLIDDMVQDYGEDGLVVCLEMTQARLARKWVAKVTGFEDIITTPGTPEAKEKLEELKAACVTAREIQRARGADLYFAYPQMVKNPEDVYKLIRDCIRRYGVKWVLFDNLQRLCDDTLENKSHRTIHLSQISKAFAKLAKDHNIKLIRILQPRQIGEGDIIQSTHTDGSSQIAKDCDCTITLWRNKTGATKKSQWEEEQGNGEEEASFSPKMRAAVVLSRYSQGGSCSLYFDGARSQVKEYENTATPAPQFNGLIPESAPQPIAVPMETVTI
jgi:hypothetical protein